MAWVQSGARGGRYEIGAAQDKHFSLSYFAGLNNNPFMVPPSDSGRTGSFITTPWPVLLALRVASPTAAQAALGQLCEIYWRPIYLFVRRSGYDADEAQDLTQKFFVYLIEREAFAKADKAKGKFRAYVLGILKHFLIHAWRDERAQTRRRRRDSLAR
jgi:Sigma-70 region 2